MKFSKFDGRNVTIGVVLFLVLFFPTLIFGVYYYQQINTNLTNQVFVQRATVAGLSASAIKVKLDKLVGIVQTYADQPAVEQDIAAGNWTNAKNDIINLQNNPANYDSFIAKFLLLNTSGTIEAAFPGITATGIGQTDDAISEWYPSIVTNGQTYFVSDVFQRSYAPLNSNHIEILAPIKEGSQIVGVVELTIPINEFSDFGKDVDITDNGFVYIVDQLGHIISHPKYTSEGPIIDYSSLPFIQQVMQGASGTGIFYNTIEQQLRAIAYEPVPVYGWGVISQEPVSEAFASRNTILAKILFTIIAFMVIELVFAFAILLLLNHRHEKDEFKKK